MAGDRDVPRLARRPGRRGARARAAVRGARLRRAQAAGRAAAGAARRRARASRSPCATTRSPTAARSAATSTTASTRPAAAGWSWSATSPARAPRRRSLTGLARHTLRAIALRDERPRRCCGSSTRRCAGSRRDGVLHGRPRDTRRRREGGGFQACLASGGHPYPLLVRAGGSVEEVVVRGTLLGVEADPVLEPAQLTLAPGDTLVALHGRRDRRARPVGERFGEERLLRRRRRAAAGRPQRPSPAQSTRRWRRRARTARDDRAICRACASAD